MHVENDTETADSSLLKSTPDSAQLEPLIDFRELNAHGANGEGLEGLTRQLGMKLGLNPHWSGRGADDGSDLIFTGVHHGAIGSIDIKWLVSCKDHARSGTAVPRNELPHDLRSTLELHGADGFLLVITTTASSGAKKLLDGNDKRKNPRSNCLTEVWDRTKLSELLLREEMNDLLKAFLPNSFARVRGITEIKSPRQAMELFEEAFPTVAYESLLYRVGHFDDDSLHGKIICPDNHDDADKVDLIINNYLIESNPIYAVDMCYD